MEKFTHKEIIDGIRELYQEWRVLKARANRDTSIRLPDFETAIDQLENETIKTKGE